MTNSTELQTPASSTERAATHGLAGEHIFIARSAFGKYVTYVAKVIEVRAETFFVEFPLRSGKTRRENVAFHNVRLTASQLDVATRQASAFATFEALVTDNGKNPTYHYIPTMRPENAVEAHLKSRYDYEQIKRFGDQAKASYPKASPYQRFNKALDRRWLRENALDAMVWA
jgi:hypothetical protein